MKLFERFPEGIWLVDFEFHPFGGREGNLPVPVCMVAREYQSGQTLRLWQDELRRLPHAPFPNGKGALLVAFYASAEFGCFVQLGWPLPANVFDLHVAFSWITNGSKWSGGRSLLAALQFYGFHSIGVVEKEEMRDLVMRGGPWNADEMHDILDYCESDVLALSKLFPKMVHKQEFDVLYSILHIIKQLPTLKRSASPLMLMFWRIFRRTGIRSNNDLLRLSIKTLVFTKVRFLK